MIGINHNVQVLEPSAHPKTVKVLVVSEDNEDYSFIKTLIKDSNYSQQYTVEWIGNYAAAINAMLKKHYDVYLLDYKIGEYTGIQLLHEAVCSNCTEPIIMLSAQDDINTDREALRIGARSYVVKGNIDGHALERTIRYALEQNTAIRDLKGNESKFRVIFERSKFPIIITDQSGKIYDANPAAVKFFELPLEKLLAANEADFYAVKRDRERFVQAMEDKGSVSDMEQRFTLRNGENKFCTVSSFVQIPQHGTSVLYYSIINDLTDRKKRETLLEEKIAVSEHIVENIVHEIQNPLSNVNLALLELNTMDDKESFKVYLDIIKENFDRIDKLTKKVFVSVKQPLNPQAGIDNIH